MTNTTLKHSVSLDQFSGLTEDEMMKVAGGGVGLLILGWIAYESYANSDQLISGFQQGYNKTRK